MKTLDRKIEEDITQVGQNNSYPTQIVINLDDLKPVDETHWQVGDTDIILTGQKHFLTTTIDGIQYCTLTKYDDEESKLNDTYPQLGNHIGLCVNKIAKETIEEGITLGSGHLLSTAHGDNTCRIVSRRWEYNEFGEDIGFVCTTPTGQYGVESIQATGYIRQIKPEAYVDCAEELVQHIKDKTKSK